MQPFFFRSRSAYRALVGASVLVALAGTACGGSGDAGVGPGSGDPSAISVVNITPASGSVDVGATDTLTAKALTQDGAAVTNAAITFTHSSPSVTTLTASGTSALVTGVALGTDTVTATAQAPHNPVVARAIITVTTPTTRVAQVRFAAHVLLVSPSQSIAAGVVAADQAGTPIPAATVTYAVSPSTLGAVNAQGAFVAASGASGNGTVIGSANGHADTLRVVVGGGASDVPLAISDTVVRPGIPLTVTAPSTIAGASATIGGTTAQVQTAGTGVTITADPQVFATCQPLGTSTTVAITAGGSARTVSLALYAPATVSLAAGDVASVTTAVSHGCPIAVANAGTYVVMPYTWDQHEAPNLGYGTTAPSVAATSVTLGLSAFAPSGIAPLGNRLPPRRATFAPASSRAPIFSTRGAARTIRRDVLVVPNTALRPARYPINPAWYRATMAARGVQVTKIPAPVADLTPPTSGGSCPVPLTLGATVQIGTVRLADGTYNMPGGAYDLDPSTGQPRLVTPIETWTLMGIGSTVAVFADTALVNALPKMPGADVRLQKLAAAYDSVIAPFIAKNSAGVPDRDGNGRVVVLIAKKAASGYAFLQGYGRVDCGYPNTASALPGEAVQPLFADFFSSDAQFQKQFASTLSTLVHETSHLADEGPVYFPTSGTPRKETWWSSEGQAVLMQYLWAYGPNVTATQAFASNTSAPPSRTVEGSATGAFCEISSHDELTRWYQSSSYPLACQFVRYTFAQTLRQHPALAIKDLFTAWGNLTDRTSTVLAYNGMTGESVAAKDVMRNWLVTWATDDAVVVADPHYTEPSVNLPAWWHTWWPGTYPVPDGALAVGQPQTVSLAEPDARFYTMAVTAPTTSYLTVAGASGAPLATGAADVAIIRMK